MCFDQIHTNSFPFLLPNPLSIHPFNFVSSLLKKRIDIPLISICAIYLRM